MKDIKSVIIICLCFAVLLSSFLFLNVIRKMQHNQDSIAEYTVKTQDLSNLFYYITAFTDKNDANEPYIRSVFKKI